VIASTPRRTTRRWTVAAVAYITAYVFASLLLAGHQTMRLFRLTLPAARFSGPRQGARIH